MREVECVGRMKTRTRWEADLEGSSERMKRRQGRTGGWWRRWRVSKRRDGEASSMKTVQRMKECCCG